MNAKATWAAAAAALVLGLGACGDDDDDDESASTGTVTQEEQPAPSGPQAETVRITETDFKIEPARVIVDKPGVVEFEVENAGAAPHALEVEGGDVEEETETIAPGESATLSVELAEGAYKLYCPVGDHEERGMVGELNVGDRAAADGDDSGSDDSGGDDDSGGGDNSGGAEAPSDDDNSGGAEAPSSGY